jgi:molybdopterin/thiamine biosynthesis adenylyltransferase
MSDSTYKESFRRNIGLVNLDEQELLHNATVGIAGLGGVGGLHMATLARMGLGGFHVADFDTFELANINRQYGATTKTVGRLKTEVMDEVVKDINPTARIKTFKDGITEENITEFLTGLDVVIDGIDFFEIDARRLLFTRAREMGIYAITCGPIGYGATLQTFSPKGMSFDKYFAINDTMTYAQKLVAFAVGLTPKPLHLKYMDLDKVSLKDRRGPAMASACTLCATLAATETLKIITNKATVKAVPNYFQFDPLRQIYKKGYLPMGGKNPIQKLKRWYLSKKFAALLEE